MAITPEDITRITAAVASGNYAADADIQALAQLGLVIRSTPDTETYETNLSTRLRDQIRGEEDLPAYRNIEKKLEELTGVKRNEGEKASDFLARIVAPMKTQTDELQAEIDRLKADKPDDQRVLTLQAELAKKEGEYQKQIKEANKQLADYKLNQEMGALRRFAEGMELSVEDRYKTDVIENRMRRLEAEVEVRFDEQGKTQYWDKKTGQQILNPTTLENPKADELVGRYFADIVAEPGAQGGTGGGTGGDGGAGKAPAAKGNYAQAKHRGQLMEMLSKDGLVSDSDEFIKAFGEVTTAYEAQHGKPMPIFGE